MPPRDYRYPFLAPDEGSGGRLARKIAPSARLVSASWGRRRRARRGILGRPRRRPIGRHREATPSAARRADFIDLHGRTRPRSSQAAGGSDHRVRRVRRRHPLRPAVRHRRRRSPRPGPRGLRDGQPQARVDPLRTPGFVHGTHVEPDSFLLRPDAGHRLPGRPRAAAARRRRRGERLLDDAATGPHLAFRLLPRLTRNTSPAGRWERASDPVIATTPPRRLARVLARRHARARVGPHRQPLVGRSQLEQPRSSRPRRPASSPSTSSG